MIRLNRSILLTTVFALTVAGLPSAASAQAAAPDANYIHVDAPFAQSLTVKTKAKHPEIAKLGLHAVPPTATDNAIIGSDIPSKLGKKSSPADMEKLAENKPIAVRVEKDKIYDLLIPITDANGGDLGGGFVVMEVPFTQASSEDDALKIGVAIRNEMQRKIRSKAALYQR